MFGSNSARSPWVGGLTPASPDSGSTHEITLIDLENDNENPYEENSFTSHPNYRNGISPSRNPTHDNETPPALPRRPKPTPNDENPPPLPERPKPLNAVSNLFQTAGQNVQGAARDLQKADATKAFNQTGRFITQKGAVVQKQVVDTFKEAGTEIPKALNQVGGHLTVVGKKFGDLDPGRIIPSDIRQDMKDMTGKAMKNEYLCTRCSELPVSECWQDEAAITSEMLSWSTPLTRVIFHSDWCRLCKLLLSMLCRPENEPLKHPEVEPYLQPEIEDLSFAEFVSKGWAFRDKHWPFGRSEERQEGATHFLGPLKAEASTVLKAPDQMKAATRVAVNIAVAATGAKPKPRVPKKPSRLTYKEGLKRGRQEGREEATKYPLSCDIYISLFTNKSVDFPGLLMVSCVGYGNRPGGEPHTLSRFRMRVAHPKIRSNLGLEAPLSYGYLLDPNWIDLSVARGWIYECESKHGTLCSQHGWDIVLQKLDSIRLIDVQKMCLVERLPECNSCRYVALSYRWSKTNVTLKYENRIEFMEEGGLRKVLHHIPKTIVDAMEVVMQLGERYLWVDALCIIQEQDDEEAASHISMMDRVYSGALCTIVAAPDQTVQHGTDIGLQGIPRHHFATTEDNSATQRAISQPSAPIKEGAHIIAPFPCQQQLPTTPWNTRAWTFQEKLLSRRLLIFSGNEVVWHCRSMIAREDMLNEDSGYTVQPLSWLNLKPKFFSQGTHTHKHWIDGSLKRDRHGRTHVVRSATFAEYSKVVKEYSRRQLSFKYDIIRALEGLLQIFAQSFRSEFIYGLPKTLLDTALLWKPTYRLKRRVSENHTSFPSWSWAGWEGPVHYDDPIEVNRDSDGEVIAYRRHTFGEEEIRPLLKWHIWDEKSAKINPLNGHGRGIPLDGTELPAEWEGSNPDLQIRRVIPQNLPPQHKQSHHLIFRTCSVSSIQLGTPVILQNNNRNTQDQHEHQQPHRLTLLDSWLQNVGTVILDSEEPQQLQLNKHEFILLGEAQLLHDTETNFREKLSAEFRFYLVMLVERQSNGTYLRCGLGKVAKEAWMLAEPVEKVIVLG